MNLIVWGNPDVLLLPVSPPAPSNILDTKQTKLIDESVENPDISLQISDPPQQAVLLRQIDPGRRWGKVNTDCV